MSQEDTLKTLIKKRGSLKAKLTQFDNYIKSLNIPVGQEVGRTIKIELNQRINYMENAFSSFDEMQGEIELISTNVDEQYTEREEFEKKYHKLVSNAKALLETAGENDDVQSLGSSVNSNQTRFEGVKLPEIKLPKFDASFENWMEFRDIFESLIHNNPQISEIQKYHYLRASLVGTAPLVIQSLEFSGDNYSLAWSTLCDRFNNKHLLIQNHLKSIFNIEVINVATASKIRHMYESLFKHLNSLKLLGEPTESWDTLLIFIITNKLDKYTAQEWEKIKTNYDSITLDIFKEFLKKRGNLLETLELHSGQSSSENKRVDTRKPNQNFKTGKNYNSRFNQTRGLVNCNENTENSEPNKMKYSCFNCNGNHSMFYCTDFLQLGVKNRIARVKELKLCFNCLKRNHAVRDCKWSGCKQCGGKHNSILHESKEASPSSNTGSTSGNNVRQVNSANSENDANITYCGVATSQNALLATARVAVYNKADNRQKPVYARALLDCGGQSSFLTIDLCNKLNLSKTKVNLAVSGINDKLSYSNYKCEIFIRSIKGNFSFDLSCFVLDKITSPVPDSNINTKQFDIPSDIDLADANFHMPQPIDILIGADAFWHILNVGQKRLGAYGPILQNTRLGWIVVGPLGLPSNDKSICNLNKNISIQNQLAKFWEVEEVESDRVWSVEEQLCEDHFTKNLSINSDGRFVVSLPFKKSPEALGQSREVALKRFLSLERKLIANKKLCDSYKDFLGVYEDLGHMTDVSDRNDDFPEYYMPHHGVLKESSTTSKLRVVFDASCPTDTGVSVNSLQMTGPSIQQDLLSIILRFRTRPVVISSDVKMMYRQVLIHPDQRKLQKIVWRSDPNDNIKTFQLNTVTYGTTAASFLAIRCLHEIANECENEHPKIADVIRNDMYVDDLLSSVASKEEAQYICKNISKILLKRGFELRKWQSNDADVIKGLDTELSPSLLEFSANKEQINKTLGLSWSCNGDLLTYKIENSIKSKPYHITKRAILSRISTVFDPLGLISPCIILAKILLQKLWSEGLTWDQEVPAHIREFWLEWSSELSELNKIKISRDVVIENPVDISVHGFADASITSYGAAVYIVSKNASGVIVSNLLCAKSKVAPIKSLTMPRLELSAALILARLIHKVLKSLNIAPSSVTCWSDSTIVLGWLKTTPNILKPFVANRIVEIENLTKDFVWRHVPTNDNPADIVSRGLNATKLMESDMWFHGPIWLTGDPCDWPKFITPKVDLPEVKTAALFSLNPKLKFCFERFSILNRLKRTFAWVLRFIKNSKTKPELRNRSLLTVDELNEGMKILIIISQLESFHSDYQGMKKGQQLPTNSKILSLHPFIDSEGILRVGGRLTNSDFPYSKRFPILLSPNHHLTKLILESEHKRLLHAGPQLLLSSIREEFWPISGRSVTRKIVRNCVTCARYNVQKIQPIMGNLPEARVRPLLPFTVVGVDYGGPFIMKDRKGRGSKPVKCWVSLFVCFSTRAIHLEIVLSLSAEDFLQAFNRFISRRGKPSEVYSDNGTNFTKANHDLQEIAHFLKINEIEICNQSANLGIKWHFIPTNSPHFGGIWEAGVKGLKQHLKRVLGNTSLFFFDFQTLIIRIESVLNARPLTPLTNDPDDLTCLSPAHFLIGRTTVSIPEQSVSHIQENRLSQYQLLQKLYEHFWSRWSREYISELQQRSKWKKDHGSVEVGQLVLIKDNNLPPSRWKLGRILSLIKGSDGVSRVANLKTADGETSRALVRLCPLPVL